MNPTLKRAFLQLCRGLGLFQLTRMFIRDKLQILCYHGFELEDESSFRPKLFIRPDTFSRRLDFLRSRGFIVLPLPDALERLYRGTLPPNSVAITIDDGFHGVGRVAAPMLEARGLPAMLYLTTYYVEKSTPIFRLVVQYMFWKTRQSRVQLDAFPWLARSSMELADSALRERVMWQLIDHGEQRCSEEERVEIARRLGVTLGVDYQHIADSRILSLMTPDEVRAFRAAGFAVELHSHRHRFPTDDEAAASREIDDNRRAIRNLTGKDARHFCYPSGIWSQQQWGWLERMGVKSATTCLPGLNGMDTPRLGLTRFLDGENISDIEFAAELYGFSQALRGLRRRLGPRTAAARTAPA